MMFLMEQQYVHIMEHYSEISKNKTNKQKKQAWDTSHELLLSKAPKQCKQGIICVALGYPTARL